MYAMQLLLQGMPFLLLFDLFKLVQKSKKPTGLKSQPSQLDDLGEYLQS